MQFYKRGIYEDILGRRLIIQSGKDSWEIKHDYETVHWEHHLSDTHDNFEKALDYASQKFGRLRVITVHTTHPPTKVMIDDTYGFAIKDNTIVGVYSKKQWNMDCNIYIGDRFDTITYQTEQNTFDLKK